MAGQAVILNLDTTGCDASASDDEKLQAAEEAAKGRYRLISSVRRHSHLRDICCGNEEDYG